MVPYWINMGYSAVYKRKCNILSIRYSDPAWHQGTATIDDPGLYQVLRWGLQDCYFSNSTIHSVMNKSLVHSFLRNVMDWWISFHIKCLIVNYQKNYHSFWCSNCAKFGQWETLWSGSCVLLTQTQVFEWPTAFWHNWIFHIHFTFSAQT